MSHSGLNHEQVVAMPDNLVEMLQVDVRRDVPSFSGVRVREEKLCQPVVWMTNAAVMPFRPQKAKQYTMFAYGHTIQQLRSFCWFKT
eukprot:6201439-Pleurochrysis_carterae.AAC.1